MKSHLKFSVRGMVLALGLLAAGVVFAHGATWYGDNDENGRDHGVRDGDRGDGYRGRNDEDYYRPARRVRVPREEFIYAPVVDVDPIVRQVAVSSPQRECWYETRELYPQRGIDRQTAAATLVGAMVGGVIGHQFDSRHSRDIGTVVGAVLGASVGHDSAASAAGTEVRSVQRCQMRDYPQYRQRVEGYRVTYVYHGREITTVMPYDPGDSVQLRGDASVPVVPYN